MLTKTRLLLCGTALTGVIWAGTFASFSDSGTAGSTFTAGTVDLVVNGDPDDAYGFTSLEMDNIKPGDVKYAPLTIANGGTLGFNYTMSTSATNPDNKGLKDKLTLEVRAVADAAACDTAGVGFLASQTVVTPSTALGGATIGSRNVARNASEVLCFRVAFPDGGAGADNGYQGATTVATFTFAANQS